MKDFVAGLLLWLFIPCSSSQHVVGEIAASSSGGEESWTENDGDERTMLDVFGEVAKDYLTHQVIPDTDAECRWDWRNVRCEPNCECGLDYKFGDFHLGRTCRRRSTASSPPRQCDVPRSTAKVFDATVEKGRMLGTHVAMQALILAMNVKVKVEMARELACLEVSRECFPEDDDPPRTLRERLLCRHIQPCNNDEEDMYEAAPHMFSFPAPPEGVLQADNNRDHLNVGNW